MSVANLRAESVLLSMVKQALSPQARFFRINAHLFAREDVGSRTSRIPPGRGIADGVFAGGKSERAIAVLRFAFGGG